MKSMLFAIALTIASPALAQSAAPADDHNAHTASAAQAAAADHSAHIATSSEDPHAGHQMPGGCCDKMEPGAAMPCCEKMKAAGKEMDCCAKEADASGTADPHAAHDMGQADANAGHETGNR